VIAAGWRVIIGEVSVGELVAVVGLAVFLSEPIATVVAITATLAQSLASARRVAAFTAAPQLLPAGSSDVDAGAPLLQLAGFRAKGLPPIDLRVGRGEFVAIAVADAADADALVAAVAGESTDYRGELSVGGADRSQLSLAAAHRAMLVSPHDVDLFTGTIRSNICTRYADGVDLDAVLGASAVTELVDLWPEGLDHVVAAGGTNLSGGQRQRIALARALAAAPPLLVLVEPTTAVDAVTEAGIAAELKRLRSADSTVVVTASPAFLAIADRVLYVSAEAGTRIGHHDELMTIDSYRELVSR
jgi:putative ABC transport system ATP-binding protein